MLAPLLALGALALAQCHNPKIPLKNRGGGGTGGDAGAAGSPSGEAGEGQGGTTAGGTTSGGTSGTGNAGSGPVGPYMMGIDISSVQEAIDGGARYVDTDGVTKDVLELFKNHGFNTVRLRTFVDPSAPYGYAQGTGGSCVKRESYCDLEHTVEFGREIKNAGMGFMLDFHYSDTWADPGKQIIPEAWREAESVEELAALLKAYTKNAISTLVDAGARPDIVQVGNEITPGMLIHVPTQSTDCWGNNSTPNPVSGSVGRWDDLAMLLIAGIEGVKEVDPGIEIVLHLENTDWKAGAIDWVENARSRGVEFDILGLSAYPAWQGEPAVWRDTFETLAETFPDLSFVIAEYNPARREANQIMFDLPDGRGRGTFFWEPTQSGVWGAALFTQMNGAYHANHADFAEFDAMKLELGL
ncbi:MAG TPA: glycosyl hydrolase 53 family protein [Polyangiaceae bacterium]